MRTLSCCRYVFRSDCTPGVDGAETGIKGIGRVEGIDAFNPRPEVAGAGVVAGATLPLLPAAGSAPTGGVATIVELLLVNKPMLWLHYEFQWRLRRLVGC